MSTEILGNIELNELSLGSIALKQAGLLGFSTIPNRTRCFNMKLRVIQPTATGISPEVWRIGVRAGREFIYTKLITKTKSQRMFLEEDRLRQKIADQSAKAASAK